MIVLEVLVVGVAGAIGMDLGQRLMQLVLGWPPSNWAMIGRWALNLPKGKLVHEDIGEEEPMPNELAVGWVVHYLVSITYGGIYIFVTRVLLDAKLGFVPAVGFAIAIVLITWFVIQPMMGAGPAASKTPKPWVTRMHDLGSHFFYGVGMWVGGLLI